MNATKEPKPLWTWGDYRKSIKQGWSVSKTKPRQIVPVVPYTLTMKLRGVDSTNVAFGMLPLPPTEGIRKRVERAAKRGDETALRAIHFIAVSRLTS